MLRTVRSASVHQGRSLKAECQDLFKGDPRRVHTKSEWFCLPSGKSCFGRSDGAGGWSCAAEDIKLVDMQYNIKQLSPLTCFHLPVSRGLLQGCSTEHHQERDHLSSRGKSLAGLQK